MMENARVLNSSGKYQLEETNHVPDWDGFLRTQIRATIYHDPRWGEIMRQVYRNQPFYLTVRSGGDIVGVLPLVAQKSVLFGHHLCSVPYFDAAGMVTEDPAAETLLLDQARKLLQSQQTPWLEIRQDKMQAGSLPCRNDKVTMVLTLPSTSEELWADLTTKVRNKVRKAQSYQAPIEAGGMSLLPEFYAVYCRTMRDLGSPPHSKRFFQRILETFPRESRLYVLRYENCAAAASFTLMDRQTVRVPWAGSDWRLRSMNFNMALYWNMLEESCRRGARSFDFGRSTQDSGTYVFKKQWGSQEVPLYWHYILNDGASVPELRPDSPKYRLLVACWKKLPVGIASRLGPRIIRNLT